MTPEAHQRNLWILYIFSLRIDREQHVPDSSNHSLYLIKLFSFSNLEGSSAGNQLPEGSISLSPSPPFLPPTPQQHTTRNTQRQRQRQRHKRHRVSNASLFCGTLEPTRMRWERGQVRVTRLRKGSNCAGVQRCQVCAPINTPPQLELSLRSS